MRMYAYERTKTPNGPGERAHLADRLRPVEVEPERPVLVAHDRGHREVGLEDVAHRDRAAARAAAAVRLRERLVQVDVHDVEAHVARARDATDRVQVRAVVVHECAGAVEDLLDLLDVLVEEPERRRIREHERRRVLVDLRAQVLDVDVAAGVGLDGRHLESRHRHRRGVRTVRRVGDHDLAPLRRFATLLEIRAHEHQAGQLALRAGGGL